MFDYAKKINMSNCQINASKEYKDQMKPMQPANMIQHEVKIRF